MYRSNFYAILFIYQMQYYGHKFSISSHWRSKECEYGFSISLFVLSVWAYSTSSLRVHLKKCRRIERKKYEKKIVARRHLLLLRCLSAVQCPHAYSGSLAIIQQFSIILGSRIYMIRCKTMCIHYNKYMFDRILVSGRTSVCVCALHKKYNMHNAHARRCGIREDNKYIQNPLHRAPSPSRSVYSSFFFFYCQATTERRNFRTKKKLAMIIIKNINLHAIIIHVYSLFFVSPSPLLLRAARIMFYCIHFFLYYISIRTFLYLFAVVPHGWTFHIRWCCSTTVSSLLLTFQLLETVSFGVQCLLFLSVACIRNCKPSHASFRLPTMSKLAFHEKNIARSILYEPKQATGKNAMYYVCTVSEEEYMERNNFHHIFLFLFHISSVYVHLSYRRCS